MILLYKNVSTTCCCFMGLSERMLVNRRQHDHRHQNAKNHCTHRTTLDQRHTRRDQSKARTCLKGHRPQYQSQYECEQSQFFESNANNASDQWQESVGTHCSHRTCGIQRHPIERNVPIVNWEQYKDKTYNDSAKQNKRK